MKLREFNKLCRIQFGKRKKHKVQLTGLLTANLTDEQKQGMLLFVVRHRKPVHKSLCTSLVDISWLQCMGYLHSTGDFIHTCEHQIK